MDKKFVSFLILSAMILIGFNLLNAWLNPIDPNAVVQQPLEENNGQDTNDGNAVAEEPTRPAESADEQQAAEITNENEIAAALAEDMPPVAEQHITLGSLDPESPFKMLVWATNRGAAIEAIALNDPRYTDLDDKSGYLGYFAFSQDATEARINAVGAGTPAAKAVPKDGSGSTGLQVGDVITKINGKLIEEPIDLRRLLATTTPGQEVEIEVRRDDKVLLYTAILAKRPLEVVRPEPTIPTTENPLHPLSYRLTLVPPAKDPTNDNRGQINEPGVSALLDENWKVHPLEGDEPGVEFRYRVEAKRFPELKLSSDLMVIKRFRLAKRSDEDQALQENAQLYHLDFDFEIKNLGSEVAKVGYLLDGPTGLPLEGWWYTYKTHPTSFGAAGVRDIIVKAFDQKYQMFTNANIVDDFEDYNAADSSGEAYKSLENDAQSVLSNGLEYAGVDAQYFASALLSNAPKENDQSPAAQKARKSYAYESVLAYPVGNRIDAERPAKTNISVRLVSKEKEIKPGESYEQEFTIFAGPKDPQVLSLYGLDKFITYGWFPLIARPLMAVLHFFHGITGNYGIAIILLTVLVRGCMFPLGRKQALNAQKMQELAPEMKAIQEKYKDDMEKRAAAQRELFRKNNYNPLAGCLPMFFQLPIFIGLYRALSVDIELRQAALIPGISWASNLSAPDQLWYWKPYLPAFLASENGWLGPYLNILPLVSVAFMIIHQKMFMPPPTDETQAMQQKMMKYMMFFFAFLFFRVPSGLCLYFITSSAWGLAERMLLPKPKPKDSQGSATPEAKPSFLEKLAKVKQSDSNGSQSVQERRRQRQKKR